MKDFLATIEALYYFIQVSRLWLDQRKHLIDLIGAWLCIADYGVAGQKAQASAKA